MKKGISLVALVVTIIVLIILTAAVIWTGAEAPEEAKLAVFYNDISTVQDAVTLKMLSNVAAMESKVWADDTTSGYGKYVGLLDAAMFNGGIATVKDGEKDVTAGQLIPSKVTATIDGTAVYQLDGDIVGELGLGMTSDDLAQFAIDKDGKVYYYNGIILDPDAETPEVYVTRDLKATNIVAGTGVTIANKNIRAY